MTARKPAPRKRPAAEFDLGALHAGAHRLAMRIYWEDTDAAGIVYYANYLKFIERGRSALLRNMGINQDDLWQGDGTAFVVRRCVIDYHLPARLENVIEVETKLGRLGGAGLELDQTVFRGKDRLASARVSLACVDRAGRPKRLPAALKAAFATFLP